MTEAAQVLKQTNSERKSLGRSAYHKKNGSAVAKLGNKPMSWQEIQSKHGKEMTYPSTDGFMDYATFEKLPSDLKIEFINKLMDKYDIGLQHISRHLFNKGDDGLKANLRNNFDILDKIDCKKARANTGLLKFRDDVEEWKVREKAAKIADEEEAQRKRDIIWKGEFITYDEFKTFPADGQVAYLNNLIRKYNISASAISKILFQISQPTLRSHLEKLNVFDQLEKSKVGNPTTSSVRIATFDKAVKKWRGETVVDKIPVQNNVVGLPKEEPNEIARDILRSIVGERQEELEPTEPETAVESAPVDIPVMESLVEKPEPEEPNELEIQKSAEEIRVEELKTNPHATVFTSNYKSIGLDSDELDGLKLLFKNKQVEVCITVRTI